MYYKQIIAILVLVFSFSLASAQAVLVWDGGHHEFTAGIEDEVYMYNAATADISGGHISALVLYDTCMLDIYNDASFGLVRPEDSGLVNIYGGTITTVFALGSSHTNIYNGLIEELEPVGSSTMDLYVENYLWDPDGGSWEGGLLTGTWLNSSVGFSIELVDEGAINHINFIPEPCSFGLIMLGTMILKNRRRSHTRR